MSKIQPLLKSNSIRIPRKKINSTIVFDDNEFKEIDLGLTLNKKLDLLHEKNFSKNIQNISSNKKSVKRVSKDNIIKINIPNLKIPLRDHQNEAINWMLEIEDNIENKIHGIKGGILSDAPGLGKTLTSLSLCVVSVHENGFPNLIICPKIVIEEWKNAIAKFFGDSYKYLHLTPNWINGYEKNDYQNQMFNDLCKYKFVITNYETIITLMKSENIVSKNIENEIRPSVNINKLRTLQGKQLIVNVNWNRIICDESHRINNDKTFTYKSIISLISDRRWCLTGTPIRNYENDIHCQFKFLGYNSKCSFTYELYKKHNLHEYILRRDYNDVDIDIPLYKEQTINIELTQEESDFYKHVLGYTKTLYKQFSNGTVSFGNVLHLFLRLRQMCVSSYSMIKQLEKTSSENISINDLIPNELKEWLYNPNGSSGLKSSKINAIMDILQSIDNEDKILIYTYFKSHMNMIKERIETKFREKVLILNGNYNDKERTETLDIFKTSKQHNILIINYSLGSEGLNLMEANNIILCENWWCPSVLEQAKHRAFRIGQKKNVKIFNIITKDTIEEKIHKICEKKNELNKQFMENVSNKKNIIMNSKTLRKIIF
jgi:SNF2 family DNA or RNA helicase